MLLITPLLLEVAGVGAELMSTSPVEQEQQKKIDLSKPPIIRSMEETFKREKKELNERHKSRRTQMKDALKSQGHVPSMLPTAKSHQVNKLGG